MATHLGVPLSEAPGTGGLLRANADAAKNGVTAAAAAAAPGDPSSAMGFVVLRRQRRRRGDESPRWRVHTLDDTPSVESMAAFVAQHLAAGGKGGETGMRRQAQKSGKNGGGGGGEEEEESGYGGPHDEL